MVIVLICMIPLAFIAGVFGCLVSVKLGLKWQIETKQGKEPTMEINPVKPIVEAVQQKKTEAQEQYSKDQIREWMFGA
jgi:hypothetical protein